MFNEKNAPHPEERNQKNAIILRWYEKYHHSVKAYATNWCLFLDFNHHYVDDVVQDTFLKLTKVSVVKLKKYDRNPLGFMNVIARNSIYDEVKRKKRKREIVGRIIVRKICPNAVLSELNCEDIYYRLQTTLTPGLAEPFFLYIQGYKHKEISHLLNKKIDTIRQAISRAKQKARAAISDHF